LGDIANGAHVTGTDYSLRVKETPERQHERLSSSSTIPQLWSLFCESQPTWLSFWWWCHQPHSASGGLNLHENNEIVCLELLWKGHVHLVCLHLSLGMMTPGLIGVYRFWSILVRNISWIMSKRTVFIQDLIRTAQGLIKQKQTCIKESILVCLLSLGWKFAWWFRPGSQRAGAVNKFKNCSS
jgi:hypothetical protein